jgi:hypothetical protein
LYELIIQVFKVGTCFLSWGKISWNLRRKLRRFSKKQYCILLIFQKIIKKIV